MTTPAWAPRTPADRSNLRRRAGVAAIALAATVLAACTTLPAASPEVETAAAAAPSAAPLPPRSSAAAPSLAPLVQPGDPPLPPAAALPRGRFDRDDDAAPSDLWARLRQGFAMPELQGELVTKWEQWYGSRPDYVQRMTERGGRYLFHIVEEVERRGMPSDLALLPFIESAFNPQAMSRASASGMWQFMPATGRDFELRQNLFRDDRRDVLASTRAALDYLQRLYTMFGDWHLALAAYNWGQGNVLKAIEANRRRGLGTSYAELRMPDETRNYVPKLQAVKNLVLRPEAFALTLPALQNHPFFLSVPIERDIDVALAAQLAGLPLDEFQQLNPQMNKPVILAAGTPRVLLPYDNANRFLRNLGTHRGALATWTAWVAPSNIKPADAARQVGMPEAQLREVNRIPARMLVRAGSTLLVPRSAQALHDVSGHIAENAAMTLAPEARPQRRVSFKAGRHGDSVAAVAKRYRVSAAQVAQWNGVSPQAQFKAGQAVVVMLAPPAARVAKGGAKRPAAKPSHRVRIAKN